MCAVCACLRASVCVGFEGDASLWLFLNNIDVIPFEAPAQLYSFLLLLNFFLNAEVSHHDSQSLRKDPQNQEYFRLSG